MTNRSPTIEAVKQLCERTKSLLEHLKEFWIRGVDGTPPAGEPGGMTLTLLIGALMPVNAALYNRPKASAAYGWAEDDLAAMDQIEQAAAALTTKFGLPPLDNGAASGTIDMQNWS